MVDDEAEDLWWEEERHRGSAKKEKIGADSNRCHLLCDDSPPNENGLALPTVLPEET